MTGDPWYLDAALVAQVARDSGKTDGVPTRAAAEARGIPQPDAWAGDRPVYYTLSGTPTPPWGIYSPTGTGPLVSSGVGTGPVLSHPAALTPAAPVMVPVQSAARVRAAAPAQALNVDRRASTALLPTPQRPQPAPLAPMRSGTAPILPSPAPPAPAFGTWEWMKTHPLYVGLFALALLVVWRILRG